MLPTTRAPAVRDHLGDREISTVPVLLAQKRSKASELPRTLAVSQDSEYAVLYSMIRSQEEL